MGYVVDKAEGVDWADGASRADETDVAEIANMGHVVDGVGG